MKRALANQHGKLVAARRVGLAQQQQLLQQWRRQLQPQCSHLRARRHPRQRRQQQQQQHRHHPRSSRRAWLGAPLLLTWLLPWRLRVRWHARAPPS
jgi:hypothetical protein